MKKFIIIAIISILVISCLSMFCYASFNNSYTFYYNDREITIEGNSLNQFRAQRIADYIAYGSIPTEEIGLGDEMNSSLLCIIFGHSIETYSATEVIHNVYTTSPKCVENYYSVEYCTRESCDYFQKTLTHSYRISECHG